MRIAVLGWAGAGKTTVAAALARALASAHGSVLAVDAATRPRLARALGLERDAAATPGLGLRGDAPESAAAGRYGLRSRERRDWVGAFTPPPVPGLDLFVLHASHADESGPAEAAPCACAADLAARWQSLAVQTRDAGPRHQVFDLDAGIGPAQRRDDPLVGAADLWLVVLEPYYRALEAAARLHALAQERARGCHLLANKVRDADDAAAITAFCARRNLPLLATWGLGDDASTLNFANRLAADLST